MQTSSNGLKFLMREEGVILHVYKDQVGIPTVGVGHVVLPGEDFSDGLTNQEAMELLRKDVGKCERAIAQLVEVTITQNMYDMLVSLSFNIGTGDVKRRVGGLAGSSVIKFLNQGNFQQASSAFLLWCKAGGVKNQGLYNRRVRESKLFLTPDPVPVAPEPTEAPQDPQPEPTPEPTPPGVLPPGPYPSAPEPASVDHPRGTSIVALVLGFFRMLAKVFTRR